MTYAGCIDNFEFTDTNGFWNTFHQSSASGDFDVNSPRWIRSLERKLNSFRALQKNWDSYGAYPIDEGALENAMQFLNSALFSGLEKPQIAPISSGGVHIEWESDGKALELEFVSLTEVHYFYSDSTGEKEGELHSNFAEARVAAREFIG